MMTERNMPLSVGFLKECDALEKGRFGVAHSRSDHRCKLVNGRSHRIVLSSSCRQHGIIQGCRIEDEPCITGAGAVAIGVAGTIIVHLLLVLAALERVLL